MHINFIKYVPKSNPMNKKVEISNIQKKHLIKESNEII